MTGRLSVCRHCYGADGNCEECAGAGFVPTLGDPTCICLEWPRDDCPVFGHGRQSSTVPVGSET